MKNLGTAGDKETETEVLLLEHDVPHQPFSQAVLSFLPKMPWSISEEVGQSCILKGFAVSECFIITLEMLRT